MRLLAEEHGYYQLSTVQRFEQEWEREASLRLRAGDADVLAEYDQRGRILDGTREQMSDDRLPAVARRPSQRQGIRAAGYHERPGRRAGPPGQGRAGRARPGRHGRPGRAAGRQRRRRR